MIESAGAPRVLLLCGSSGIGGMERAVIGIARHLDSKGWRVEVMFSDSPKAAELVEWAATYGVAVSANPAVISVLSEKRSWRSVLRLARAIRRVRPDVVNLHYSGGHVSVKDILAVRLAGVNRCVANVHHPVGWGQSGRRKRIMTRVSAWFCETIVVYSDAVRAIMLDAGIPPRKVRLCNPGVKRPKQSSKTDARAEFGLGDEFVLGCVARLVPDKGVADLIQAFATRPAGTLLIAGDGPERETLELLAERLCPGRVRFLGKIGDDELELFYAALDAFALASYLEGFGLVFLEAAMHAVPSVGTRVGGVANAIVDGQTGLLVGAGDIEAFAEALQKLGDDPELRRRLGSAAQERAVGSFTEEAMGEAQARVLQARPH